MIGQLLLERINLSFFCIKSADIQTINVWEKYIRITIKTIIT